MGKTVCVHYRQREDDEMDGDTHTWVGITAFQFRNGEIRLRCVGCVSDEWGHHDTNVEWVEVLP